MISHSHILPLLLDWKPPRQEVLLVFCNICTLYLSYRTLKIIPLSNHFITSALSQAFPPMLSTIKLKVLESWYHGAITNLKPKERQRDGNLRAFVSMEILGKCLGIITDPLAWRGWGGWLVQDVWEGLFHETQPHNTFLRWSKTRTGDNTPSQLSDPWQWSASLEK